MTLRSLCDWNVMQRCGVFKNSCSRVTHMFSVVFFLAAAVKDHHLLFNMTVEPWTIEPWTVT